ncbi:hypothetical protein BGZ60DRAFT_533354 [Tricladium varicosporioides]|nr:hypothetical protein BGZ60DRAFT_533354 [Hymenoscyphus varicosporioides]
MTQNATIAIVVVCAFVIWTALLALALKLVNNWAQRMADTKAAEEVEKAEASASAAEEGNGSTTT